MLMVQRKQISRVREGSKNRGISRYVLGWVFRMGTNSLALAFNFNPLGNDKEKCLYFIRILFFNYVAQ